MCLLRHTKAKFIRLYKEGIHLISALVSRFSIRKGGLFVFALLFFGSSQVSLAATLISEYRFEESSWNGTANEILDSSGNGYHGRLNNNSSPETTSPALSGNLGTCGYANQNDGAIEITGLPLDTSTNGVKTTVTFWMNWDGTNNVMPIGWDTHDIWMVSGSIGFNTGNSDVYGISSAGLANGWHHVAVEFTNGSVTSNRMYIDGVEQVLTQRQSSPNNSRAYVKSELRIGGWSRSSGYDFHGLMDEVRVYQGSLTTSEVGTIMADRHPCPSTPIAEYRFDELTWDGTANEVIDSSVNANNGARIGGINTVIGKICNAADIPSNTSSATYEAVDTGIDLDTVIGSSGTISLWYKGNSAWNSGTDKRLFDATDGNKYFFGEIKSDGRVKFWFEDGSDGDYQKTTVSTFSVGAGVWKQLTFVWDVASGTAQIYVDGVAQSLSGGNGRSTPFTGFDTLYFGDNRDASYITGQSSADGLIDEALVFDAVLEASQIQRIFTNQDAGNNYDGTSRTCPSPAIPLLEYRFEETSWDGTADEIIDYSGNDYHAQLNNNSIPETSSPALTGDPGTCGYASQNDGSIQATGLPLDTTTNGVKTTVTFWMNWDGTNNVMPIGWDTHDIWMVSGSIGFNTGNSDVYGISSAGLANGWHHVAVEFTNGSVTSNRMYIDGVEQVLTQRQSSPNNGRAYVKSELRIGGWSRSSGYDFHGLIDEVRVYESALTTAQVLTIMSERHPCSVGTPVAEYRFDELSWDNVTNDVLDSSGNALHGISQGTSPVSGLICNAADFDRSNNIQVANNTLLELGGSNSDYTVNFWLNPRTTTGGWTNIIHKGNSNFERTFAAWFRPGNSRIHHRVSTSSSGNEGHDTDAALGLNTWSMVTLVKTDNQLLTYVNGVLAKQSTLNGSSVSNDGTLYIGDDPWYQGIDALMDELTIFDSALSAGEIESIRTNNLAGNGWDGSERTCITPLIHHYEVSHDGQGLTCDTESVTVKACTNESCSLLSAESVTLDFLANGTTVSSPTFTGSSIVNFNHTEVETLTFSIANATITASDDIVCDDGSGISCEMAFTDAGFRFLYGSTNSTTIPNQISGAEFSDTLKLQALKDVNGVCTGLFNGDNYVDLSQENVDPGGSSGLSFTVNGSGIAKHSSVSNTQLNFGANSIATLPASIYNDAGKIRLHANYDVGGVALTGSSNSFWVSPAELVVTSGTTLLNGASASAKPTYKAGVEFDLTVTAYNAASTPVPTPNYSPGQIQFKLERIGPTLTESVDGYLTFAPATTLETSTSATFTDVALSNFSSGVSSYDAAQYSEVGVLNLDVQDNDYGNVGIVIPAEAINIGRFVPDHFKQTVAEDGSFIAVCNTETAFAYSGQKDAATNSIGTISYLTNPVLAITAYNKQGDITQNYYEDSQGSVNDYMKLSSTDITITTPTNDEAATGVDNTTKLTLTANMNTGTLSQNDLTKLPNIVALPKGVLHYQLSDDDNFFYNRSANALVAPFTSEVDFSTASITDEDSVNLLSSVDASSTGVEIRFGRLLLKNSFGSETSDLPLPMQVEYFNGTEFVLSSNDDCTSYDAANISTINTNTTNSLDPALTSGQGGIGSFISGKTQEIELKAPGARNRGDLRVSYDAYDWLKFDWNNSGTYQNPSAIATFGLYRGNDRIIYMREVLK